jgi:hypothetical protein
LYLTDTAENQGAFRCVSGFHRRIETWLKTLPTGANPRAADFAGEATTKETPRVVQYMNMRPSKWEYSPEWK